jgi:predicted GNAT family N-acyltransferase
MSRAADGGGPGVAGVSLRVDVPAQTLELYGPDGALARRYAVSTSRYGLGEQRGSHRTPRGRHLVRARIGAGAPADAVFVGRRATGERWTPELAAQHPERDWILTRILWLSGCEPGFNRLGEVDTMRRYIYLHGVPDDVPMGVPGSIGCVRMRNADIVELFDLVPAGAPVTIDPFHVEIMHWDAALTRARPLREQVFVVEQGVPRELEWDDRDAASRHALVFAADGSVAGTGRLLPDGHIGRMAVRAPWRGQGAGAALLRALMGEAQRLGMRTLRLHAQIGARGFYARHGFAAEGEEYMEAGIAHVNMRRELAGGPAAGAVEAQAARIA